MSRCTVLAATSLSSPSHSPPCRPMRKASSSAAGWARLSRPSPATAIGTRSSDSASGGFAGFKLGERVTIYGELSFVRKGYSSEGYFFRDAGEGVVEEVTLDWTVHLDYLELQVPLAVMFPTGGRLRPRLYAVPSLALELGCGWSLTERSVFISGGSVIGTEHSESTGDCADEEIQTETIDIGILFGGGLDKRIGGGALTADVRYNLGLIDIDDSDGTLKNRAFQVLLGYSYFVR